MTEEDVLRLMAEELDNLLNRLLALSVKLYLVKNKLDFETVPTLDEIDQILRSLNLGPDRINNYRERLPDVQAQLSSLK